MIRKTLTFLIVAVLAIGGYALAYPERANEFATKFLQGVTDIEEVRLPLIGGGETSFKVVDPATIASELKEGGSNLVALFDKRKESAAKLSIEDIIDATNKERIAAALPPLKTSTLLIESAKIKTEDMIVRQYFEHESPTGESVSDLGKKVGYDYLIMGENLALGDFSSAGDLLKAWMESPGHRANILNTSYQEIGVYAIKGSYEGRTVWFAVQHFGTGRGACPAISITLKREIDALNTDLNKQQQEIGILQKEIEGMSTSDPRYRDKVDLFNAKVSTYNATLANSREKITLYNSQVAKFNACLTQYQ